MTSAVNNHAPLADEKRSYTVTGTHSVDSADVGLEEKT